MKLTWIIPSKIICGGNRVVFEYSNRLLAKGHEVTIIIPFEHYPPPGNLPRKVEIFLREKLYYQFKFKTSLPFASKIDWFPVKAKVIEVPDLREKFIPNSDAVIATAWETAEWVNTYPK
ncbi:MAG: hypothetical protein ACPL4K_03130, partial [Candidatus Margulisiibacteriota bacterium]